MWLTFPGNRSVAEAHQRTLIENSKRKLQGMILLSSTPVAANIGARSLSTETTRILLLTQQTILSRRRSGRLESIFSASRNSRRQNHWCTRRFSEMESSSLNL